MLDWTDRHCRYFLRLISKHSVLYTEMVTTGAIIHGDQERHLRFHQAEHPVALQLGGSDPKDLALCAKIATDYGYDEINLNVGCPSDRVQSGRFGACLMRQPELVAECVNEMQNATPLPITVKTRLGIDDDDNDEFLYRFIEPIRQAGCRTLILHARKAWLSGLSPKQNREIPPLQYSRVHKAKVNFPDLEIIINGGLTSHDEIHKQLQHVDGVMIGREAYHNPFFLAEVDQRYYASDVPVAERNAVINAFIDYAESEIQQGIYLKHMTRHILGLFQGQVGAKRWRRHISQHAYKPGANTQVLRDALELMEQVS